MNSRYCGWFVLSTFVHQLTPSGSVVSSAGTKMTLSPGRALIVAPLPHVCAAAMQLRHGIVSSWEANRALEALSANAASCRTAVVLEDV